MSFLKVLDCRKVANYLSYLMSVAVQFEPVWARAFLRRCRFLDPEFQGELLVVISKRTVPEVLSPCLTCGSPPPGLISPALRNGTPIPRITPYPLLDRFLRYSHGFNVVREDEDGKDGLPKTTTPDLLEDK